MLQHTRDGSHTLYSAVFDATYHSVHGAIQEAQHVFIDAALLPFVASNNEVQILEIGFGTGLNALMTVCNCIELGKNLHYTAYEAYPISHEISEQLNFYEYLSRFDYAEYWQKALHAAVWDTPVRLDTSAANSAINLHKVHDRFENIAYQNQFDIIYFDAFAPNTQAELWTIEIFKKMYVALRNGGALVTYCAKGEVKRNMRAAGFEVQALLGPLGKREMTKALKL